MAAPLSDNIEEWSFSDLVKWASWEVITAIVKGQALEGAMHPILVVVCRWRDGERNSQEATRTKAARHQGKKTPL